MADFSDLAGHPVLDLVNTVSWRLAPERSTNALADYHAVLAWSRQFDLLKHAESVHLWGIADADPRAAESAHGVILQFRDAVYDVVTVPPSQTDSARSLIAAAYVEAVGDAELVPAEDHLVWADSQLSLSTPLHRLARLAVAMLAQTPLGRVRQCADEACGYVFLDASPRQNRRWCSATYCGNRNRVRRHHQLRRGQR